MISIRLKQIYNGTPYYEIDKKGRRYYSLGSNQAIQIIKRIKKGREKINIEDLEGFFKEHSDLLENLK